MLTEAGDLNELPDHSADKGFFYKGTEGEKFVTDATIFAGQVIVEPANQIEERAVERHHRRGGRDGDAEPQEPAPPGAP